MSEKLWSVTGVCEELGLSPGTISNWRNRYTDTPPPTHHVYSGQEVRGARFNHEAWDADGLKAWKKWYVDHAKKMNHRYRRTRAEKV